MESSTLLYIAWPLTLGLSFMAGSIDFSSEPTTEKSKIVYRNSSSNDSSNANSATTNLHSSATSSRRVEVGVTESYDIKEITNTNDPQKRMTKFLRMIDQLGPGDFEQVLADFRELGGSKTNRNAEYLILFNAWAKVNPEGALAYAKENYKSTFPAPTILSTWAGYAPDAAIQWVKLNHQGDKANPYLIAVIKGIASTNLERATDMLQALPYDQHTDKTILAILPYVSKLGVEKSIAWLATIKDEEIHSSTSKALASSLAKKDPQGTIDWLQTLPEDSQRGIHRKTIARTWAKLDIDKATEWTSSFEGRARSGVAFLIIAQLAYTDPIKTQTWMRTMSDDPDYKYVLWSFVNATKHDHPEIALANLEHLQDEARAGQKYNLLRDWAYKNKVAATQWMRSNNIDAATQEKVFSDVAKGFGRLQDRYNRPD